MIWLLKVCLPTVVDLPGSGFSDKTVVKERDMLGVGVLGRF